MTQSITSLCRDHLLTGGFWHCRPLFSQVYRVFPKSTMSRPQGQSWEMESPGKEVQATVGKKRCLNSSVFPIRTARQERLRRGDINDSRCLVSPWEDTHGHEEQMHQTAATAANVLTRER